MYHHKEKCSGKMTRFYQIVAFTYFPISSVLSVQPVKLHHYLDESLICMSVCYFGLSNSKHKCFCALINDCPKDFCRSFYVLVRCHLRLGQLYSILYKWLFMCTNMFFHSLFTPVNIKYVNLLLPLFYVAVAGS